MDAEVVMVTFECPACDKRARVIKGKKVYRCTFCATETKGKVARAGGMLTSPDLKKEYDLWSRKGMSRELDRIQLPTADSRNGTRTSGGGKTSRSKKRKSSSTTRT